MMVPKQANLKNLIVSFKMCKCNILIFINVWFFYIDVQSGGIGSIYENPFLNPYFKEIVNPDGLYQSPYRRSSEQTTATPLEVNKDEGQGDRYDKYLDNIFLMEYVSKLKPQRQPMTNFKGMVGKKIVGTPEWSVLQNFFEY